MRRRKADNKKIVPVILFAALLIGLFALVLHLIEKHGLIDEQFGDMGLWGSDSEETEITLNGTDYITGDDIDTYLLIGTDGGGEDLGKAYSGELADFLMLLIVDNTTEKFGFYTIDRNTVMEVQMLDSNGNFSGYYPQQICLSHWYGTDDGQRNDNTVEAVSRLLGNLDIDNYFTINMDDIGRVNDAIGGVTVNIEDDMTSIDPDFEQGAEIELTGEQAEKYLRARFALEDASNASRMRRQQQYMENAYAKLIDEFRSNPEYVNDLYDQLADQIDSDGSSREVSVAVNHMMQYGNQGFIKFDGETKRNDTQGDGVEHEEFYVDESSILEGLLKVVDFKEE